MCNWMHILDSVWDQVEERGISLKIIFLADSGEWLETCGEREKDTEDIQ